MMPKPLQGLPLWSKCAGDRHSLVAQTGAALTVPELYAHCLAQMARFKRPKHYRLVDALPKNNHGQVLKTELRARLASG